MASPEAEKFAELLRSAPPMAELPLAEQRAAGEHAEDMTTIPPGVCYTAVQDRVRIDLAADAPVAPDGVEFTAAHPVRGLWAVPPAAPADRALLYLFGGGHVITSVARGAGSPGISPSLPACGYWRWTTRSPRSTRSPPT
jgi:hypothetical protein